MTKDNNPGPGHNSGVDQAWLNKQLGELRKLGNTLLDNKKLKEVAGKTRSTWISYGAVLAEVREVIPSNKAFNAWLKENDLEAYADRNNRTDAMWLSRMNEDMLSLIPAELHSPKAIRAWYRKSLKAALEENDGDVEAALDNPVTSEFAGAVDSGDWDVAVAAYEAAKERETFEEKSASDAAKDLLKKLAKHSDPYAVFDALKSLIEGGALDEQPEEQPEQVEDDFEGEDDYEGEDDFEDAPA